MKIFQFSIANNSRNKVRVYADHASLFEGLKREEDNAILLLYSKVSHSIIQLGNRYRLAEEDIEELICDCITLMIKKIREGAYIFQGYDPASFVIEVAKNKVKAYYMKNQKAITRSLDAIEEPIDETELTDMTATDDLKNLLSKLSSNCQRLIELKYLEERRDKEVIELKLTQYTTVDALKNHRALCMKKLTEMAAIKFK